MDVARTTGRVVVVGSANLDLSVTVEHLPHPGETVIAGQLDRRCGGKGANQAAAAGRLGAPVRLVAAVGDDDASLAVIEAAAAAGVVTDHLQRIPSAVTGTAYITVDGSGENTIVVVPGANAELDEPRLGAGMADLTGPDVVLVSLEIPIATAAAALRLARARGATAMLNPSPFSAAVADLLAWVDVVIVNEGEAAALGQSALDPAEISMIVTLGGDGARVRPAGSESEHVVAAPRVEVVDTTGCGDAFAGAVAAELAAGADLVPATRLAVRYAALAATARGAQSSYRDRVAFQTADLGG